jgi:putative hydrolase, CocE/NonD family
LPPGGAHLAAGRCGAESRAAILEYLPYRKRDGTAERDHLTHPYFAGNGYACIRVDMRGSGESDGLLDDEYLKQEQDDCLEVLKWIATQPWCTGSIGMIGISWGGFNGLQVAARRPAELKAVISLCSTDDRYADDIHFMGGCLLNDNLQWASVMLGYMSRTPDKALLGDAWRDVWLKRLNHQPLLVAHWLAISAATSCGSMAPSARIGAPSPAPSISWAAGPTAIPIRSRACWPICNAPRRG